MCVRVYVCVCACMCLHLYLSGWIKGLKIKIIIIIVIEKKGQKMATYKEQEIRYLQNNNLLIR